MSSEKHLTKEEKAEKRRKRRQRFMEALRYHHRPNAEKLAETLVKGGVVRPEDTRNAEDKVRDSLKEMRYKLNSARERVLEQRKNRLKGARG